MLPYGLVQFVHGNVSPLEYARAVDQRVDAAEVFHRAGHQRLDLRGVRNVHHLVRGLAPRGVYVAEGFFQPAFVDIGEHGAPPGLRATQGRGPSDAHRRAGYDDRLVLERHVFVPS